MLDLAYALAVYAHKGQTDKAGAPYILHPLAVMNMVDDDKSKVVALLHDVVEDTPITEATIRNLFGLEIADAVTAITRRPGETYDGFIKRAGQNKIARKVKIADLTHNMDLSRLLTVTEADMERAKKYKKALIYLSSLG